MQLEKDKLYICFHKPTRLIGHLIALWTLWKYSHVEFIYNGQVFLSNPGGVRTRKFEYQKNMEIYELDKNIDPKDVIEFFRTAQGKGYDYLGILGQFFYADKVQDDNRYFCSEFCLNAMDYALQFTLTYKGKSLKDRVGYQFNPSKLFKYLKNMELIKEKEAIWMNMEKLICTEIELDGKKYKVVGIKFEKDNIILNVEEIKEVM